MFKIYFNGRSIAIIPPEAPASGLLGAVRVSEREAGDLATLPERFSQAASPEFLEIESGDPQAAFKALTSQFRVDVAAGGLVRDAAGRALLFWRRGAWDMPKGHIEAGESLEQCALREVQEETGLEHLALGRPICTTYHTYREGQDFVLKESHWFRMTLTAADEVRVQREEDIETARWCDESQLQELLKGAYPSIRDVFKADKEIQTNDNMKEKEIAGRFAISGNILEIKPLGNGLINDTLLVKTDGSDDYVLQRINNSIFKDVELLQHNIDCATAHIRRKLAGDADINRKVLTFLPCKETGKSYWTDGKEYWRVSIFIKDAYTYETVDPKYSYFAGKAFGNFEAMLADIPDTLGETIPDFHNMELRARQLHEAVAADRAGRMAESEVREILAKILPFEEEMCKAERMYREGLLPKRICHCDTKVNNMMFDADGNILCVIDLDTLMPSFVFSDFGDFLRTAANTLPEDDPAWKKVDFRMDIFEAFAKGYLEGATFLTPVEKENLPFAACLFPYMQAVRFFTDYINGDTYYKIKYPEHNLVRTRNQWALFEAARRKVPQMQAFIK